MDHTDMWDKKLAPHSQAELYAAAPLLETTSAKSTLNTSDPPHSTGAPAYSGVHSRALYHGDDRTHYHPTMPSTSTLTAGTVTIPVVQRRSKVSCVDHPEFGTHHDGNQGSSDMSYVDELSVSSGRSTGTDSTKSSSGVADVLKCDSLSGVDDNMVRHKPSCATTSVVKREEDPHEAVLLSSAAHIAAALGGAHSNAGRYHSTTTTAAAVGASRSSDTIAVQSSVGEGFREPVVYTGAHDARTLYHSGHSIAPQSPSALGTAAALSYTVPGGALTNYDSTCSTITRFGASWPGLYTQANGDGEEGSMVPNGGMAEDMSGMRKRRGIAQGVFGQQLPLARVRKIMKLDRAVTAQLMISGDAPLVLAGACELLIQELTQMAWQHICYCRRRTLQRHDVIAAVCASPRYDFLLDLLPKEAFDSLRTTFDSSHTNTNTTATE